MSLLLDIDGDLQMGSQNSFHGPFVYDGIYYGVFINTIAGTGAGRVSLMSATSPLSSWAQQDNVIMAAGTVIESIWVTQKHDKLHVAGQEASTNFDVYHVEVDLASETFGTVHTIDTAPAGDDGPNAIACSIASEYRGDDLVAVYQGESDKDMGTAYATIDAKRSTDGGVNWSAVISVAGVANGVAHYTGPVIVAGANDNMHIFFKDHSNGDLYNRGMTPADSLTNFAAGLIDNNVQTNPYILGGATVIRFNEDSAHVACLYHDSSGRSNVAEGASQWRGTFNLPALAPGDNFTWSAGGGGSQSAHVLCNDGETLHVLYADDTTFDIYRDENPIGEATWGSSNDVEEFDAVTGACLSAAVIHRAGQQRIGLFFAAGDTGSTFYDEIDLTHSIAALSAAKMGDLNSYHGPFEV